MSHTIQYNLDAKWLGIGNNDCENPKRLYESIILKPENIIESIQFGFFDDENKYEKVSIKGKFM